MQPPPALEPVCALVPLRTGGKTRLGTVLTPERREALAHAMLDDVLTALRDAGVDDVRILASGEAALAAAAARGLPALPDPGPDRTTLAARRARTDDPAVARLRAAVDHGLGVVGPTCARLVVAADLPLLTEQDVRAVLAALDASASDVVITPTPSGGTALLALGPGVVLTSQHGPDSARAHTVAAQHAGLRVTRLEREGGRDVDDAHDLELLRTLLGTLLPDRRRATAALLGTAHG
jgi:2-phospho-L-lactate guanylyltransferase